MKNKPDRKGGNKMKKKLDGINVLYPTPTVLVGAMVAGCWNVGKQLKKKP